MDKPILDPSLIEDYERQAKLIGGYTAFVAGLLVATIAKSGEYPRAYIVIALLAVSLPSLIAWMRIDFIVRVAQARTKSGFRSLAGGLGILPSFTGIAILIGHFSILAAVLFVLLSLFWALIILGEAVGAAGDPNSTV